MHGYNLNETNYPLDYLPKAKGAQWQGTWSCHVHAPVARTHSVSTHHAVDCHADWEVAALLVNLQHTPDDTLQERTSSPLLRRPSAAARRDVAGRGGGFSDRRHVTHRTQRATWHVPWDTVTLSAPEGGSRGITGPQQWNPTDIQLAAVRQPPHG